ncbi:MAG TPA: hypothetical protein VHZ03_33965 [Trebonia sp.]|nr:hypothetical protein [Trebonia sp.]
MDLYDVPVGVDTAGVPLGDLLDQPGIAVRIAEGEERPVAGALGVDPGLAGLGRERRAVPDLAGVDATADKLFMSGLDVRDDQPPEGRAGRGRGEPRAERDRGRGARGVNWTMRRPSIGATSSSSRQPRRS